MGAAEVRTEDERRRGDLFIEQSRKSPKFDQCEVEREWDEVQDTNGRAPVTRETIIHCAKVDNYDGYVAWNDGYVAWRMAQVSMHITQASVLRSHSTEEMSM